MKRRIFLLAATLLSAAALLVVFVFLTVPGSFDERTEGDDAPATLGEHLPLLASGSDGKTAVADEADRSSGDREGALGANEARAASSLPLTASEGYQTSVKRVLFEETTAPDGEGYFERRRVVETDLRYPMIRVVEKVRIDPEGGDEVLMDRQAMAADHAVLQLDHSVSKARLQDLMMEHGLQLRREVRPDGLYLVEFPVDGVDSLVEVMARLNADQSAVRFAEPDYVVAPLSTPNDPKFFDQSLWGLKNTGQRGGRPGADIAAVPAWDVRTDASNVIVAVIDTGVRVTHEDLAANIWRNPRETLNGRDDSGSGYIDDIHGVNVITGGPPVDLDGHGTHVAGTIGAAGNNGVGVTGVAWKVQLMGIKFLDPFGFTSDAVLSIDYARENGAHILNNSWGGGGFSHSLVEAIRRTRDAGLIFVAAAGNSAMNNDVFPAYPASYEIENVVSVASMNRHGELSNFSNYGLKRVHLMAPGGTGFFLDRPEDGILSTWNTSDTAYNAISGTSMASPHVAGIFALLKAEFPAEDPERLINRVLSGSIEVPAFAARLPLGRRAHLYRSFGRGGLPVALQPIEDAEFLTGDAHTFTVEAIGEKPLTYTWFKDGNQLEDANGPSLSLADLSPLDAGVYRVEVSNPVGQIASEAKLTHLLDLPEIGETLGASHLTWITMPEAPWQAGVMESGRNAVRSGAIGHNSQTKVQTAVAGPGELTFWWKVSSEQNYDKLSFSINGDLQGAALSGETEWRTRTYSIPDGTHTLTWSYAKDGSVSKGQDAGWLADVSYTQFSPRIAVHPESVELAVGDSYALFAQASGSPALQWYWTRGGQVIANSPGPDPLPPGATRYFFNEISLGHAGLYRAVVNNSYGSVVTRTASVTVVEQPRPPAVTRQPGSVIATEGNPVVFSVDFEGTWPFEIQWFKDGSLLEGEEMRELLLSEATEEDSGVYAVVINNRAGSVESEEATLTVGPAPLEFSDWIASFEGIPADRRGLLDDPAGDGVTSLLKFALGLDPREPVSSSALTVALVGGEPIGVFGGGNASTERFGSIAFKRAKNVAGINLELEASEDLIEWTAVPAVLEVLETLDSARERVRLREAEPLMDANRRFYRVRVSVTE